MQPATRSTRRSIRRPARGRRVLLGAVLAGTALTCGCSAARDAAPRPTGTVTSAAPTSAAPATPGSPTRSPARTPTGTPRPTPSPRPQLAGRPAEELTSTARPRQVTGLVRIVASIGTTGRGETSTGMVLTGDGEVLTNNHGVAGATAIQVSVLSSGRAYRARLRAADPGRDVALLRLDGASGLDTVTLARSDARVGAPVTVVGDARGLRSVFTASTGNVVAVDQTLVAPATATVRAERLTGLVLSTADVVLGESGGPTYDAAGRVLGMTTAAVRLRSGLYGVAIPVSTLRIVIGDLEQR